MLLRKLNCKVCFVSKLASWCVFCIVWQNEVWWQLQSNFIVELPTQNGIICSITWYNLYYYNNNVHLPRRSLHTQNCRNTYLYVRWLHFEWSFLLILAYRFGCIIEHVMASSATSCSQTELFPRNVFFELNICIYLKQSILGKTPFASIWILTSLNGQRCMFNVLSFGDMSPLK